MSSLQATRKVAKCGYLFVAPGWDFTIPINRTKRWQRRWFVLYDDGELSYSLDEHPETVPQASIDMNKVLEVASAEEITGNPFSLAITAPDIVHFVKGTSREEARFWNDVLSVFPRSKGRHKRNATFPGTQCSSKSTHILQTPPIRGPVSDAIRNQYNSRISTPVWEGDDVFPTKDNASPKSSPIEQISRNNTSSETRKVYMGSPPTRDKVEEKSRTRRMANREKRGLKSGRSFSEDITKMVPSWQDKPSSKDHPEVSHRLLLEEYESECKLKNIADSITRPRSRTAISASSQQHCLEPTRDGDPSAHKQVRGDPDGCGLDVSLMRYSPSDLRVDLPAEDLLNIKRGWLMKQGQDKEWTKHWFVLRGNGLLYYRDPKAEDQGILDGVIDLSSISSVIESQVQRNYGLQLCTWDGRQFVLSAVTAGIRTNWMSALRKAAGIQDSSLDLSSPTQEGELALSSSSTLTARSLLLSSDDDYKTASESGSARRESGEWGEALPPSPPLNRTPMSRVKERARGVSKWRGYGNKRSRSSPPNSRRSTLDSVSSQELIACSQPLIPENKAKELSDANQDGAVFKEKKNSKDESFRQKHSPDVVALERKVENLFKKGEETGNLRAKDFAELQSFKSRYVEEKVEWEKAMQSVESALENANSRVASLCTEVSEQREMKTRLEGELHRLEVRLACAIDDNEALYQRVRELDRPSSAARDRARSVDSLSDLTNIDLDLDLDKLDKDRIAEEYNDLRTRFEKAVSEIRALKRELRESQAAADWLELSVVSARQEAKGMKEEAEASSKLMAARIQDLASKLSSAEKQIRSLKQKLAKTETREKRRSLSLKGRESFTICKELEEKLTELENKMNIINPSTAPVSVVPLENKKVDKVSSRLRRKSLDSATGSEPLKVFLRLSNLEAKLAMTQIETSDNKQVELKLFNGECDEMDGSQKSEMVNEVKKMENLLRTKLVVLAKKKESLMKAGQWTNEAKLNLLAEKLAYESVLIGRLHDAVMESKCLDVTDAERLINSLDSKISGGKPNIETSLDYLVKSLAKHLTQQGVKRVSRKVKERKKHDPVIAELMNKKSALDSKVEKYINEVVHKLASAFSMESLADDTQPDRNLDRIKDAWTMAQEAVNQELIQVEITQVLSQASQTYRSYIEAENETRFAGIVKERANLEMWMALADEGLARDMASLVTRLEHEYKARLHQFKAERLVVRATEEDEAHNREILCKLVDVVAHKALLDARVAVLSSSDYSDPMVDPDQTSFDENSLLSEIQFLYVKFCRELSQDSKDEERLKEAVERISKEVCCLSKILNPEEKISSPEKSEGKNDAWIDSLCRKCEQLREKLITLQKLGESSKECKNCIEMQQEIMCLEKHHSKEISELERKQELELNKMKADFEEQKANLLQHYKAEESKLIDRNKRLELKLESWEEEFMKESEDIKTAYNKTLNSTAADLDEEENMRQRYQAEIQHLRAVCEKGLLGMENSHRRQIVELQEKHERELKSLKLEKEQALAEETHATLAALDAMRKAHEAEVQKEVAKFKAEYVSKMQSTHDITALHKQHQAEMEEIKKEILSLTDKYSIKCVESVSLEDKLRVATQQLAHAHQHIIQLDARNRQLRAHLVAEASSESVSRLHDHPHGEGVTTRRRVVSPIAKQTAANGGQAYAKSSLSVTNLEPPPLLKSEVSRCPEGVEAVCSGMVSRRRLQFERRCAPNRFNSTPV
ncbi:myosin phosphatase Rho interacting protein outspread isoform X3 [Rhodnius prolixus]|uniref:myosin phosphatase Rho interacting protein outspread isoform X3 n=1 Tax=Rhodnius prolixus TaxID=13249 RepID=UPI003D18CBA2